MVQVVDLATGKSVARASVPSSVLVVLRFRGGRLTLEQMLRLEDLFFHGTFGPNFTRPVFVETRGREVVVRVSAEYEGAGARGVRALLTRDLLLATCRAGRPLPDRVTLALVDNPSRPLPPNRARRR